MPAIFFTFIQVTAFWGKIFLIWECPFKISIEKCNNKKIYWKPQMRTQKFLGRIIYYYVSIRIVPIEVLVTFFKLGSYEFPRISINRSVIEEVKYAVRFSCSWLLTFSVWQYRRWQKVRNEYFRNNKCWFGSKGKLWVRRSHRPAVFV